MTVQAPQLKRFSLPLSAAALCLDPYDRSEAYVTGEAAVYVPLADLVAWNSRTGERRVLLKRGVAYGLTGPEPVTNRAMVMGEGGARVMPDAVMGRMVRALLPERAESNTIRFERFWPKSK